MASLSVADIIAHTTDSLFITHRVSGAYVLSRISAMSDVMQRCLDDFPRTVSRDSRNVMDKATWAQNDFNEGTARIYVLGECNGSSAHLAYETPPNSHVGMIKGHGAAVYWVEHQQVSGVVVESRLHRSDLSGQFASTVVYLTSPRLE